MSWRNTVLELYEPDEGWPTEGEPADWIAEAKVGWCQGTAECLVVLTPMWRIAWWKVKYWAGLVAETLSYYFYWKWWMMRHEKEFEWYEEID